MLACLLLLYFCLNYHTPMKLIIMWTTFLPIVVFCFCFTNASKPQLFQLQKRIELPENRTYILSCNLIAGSQPIQFEWLKDHRLLSEVESRFKVDNSEDASILTLRKLQQSDAGTYTCSARNQFGSDSTSTEFLIKSWFALVLFAALGVAPLAC